MSGGDLRTIGKGDSVVKQIQTPGDFDKLFELLFHANRNVVMRAADCIEKITRDKPAYLSKHKREILQLFYTANNKELKWHLAQLVPRAKLNDAELKAVWKQLSQWAFDKKESKIVRVNSIQGMFELLPLNRELKSDFNKAIEQLEKQKIPSLTSRINKLRRAME